MARRNAHFRRRFNASGPLERVLILIVLAVAIGVTIGLLLPQVSSDAAKITGGYTATGSAADTLNALAVDDNQSSSGYDRDSFGFRTTDVDGNGCDVRDDVLARDLTDITYKYAGSVWSSPAHWPIRTPLRPSILYVAAPPAPKCRSTMWWPLKTLGNPVRATGPLPNAMNSAMTPTTCWPSTARPIRRRGRFRRLLATHQRRLPLRLRGPPDWRQRQVPAHRHLPRKGRHARRPPHLPRPGRARRPVRGRVSRLREVH